MEKKRERKKKEMRDSERRKVGNFMGCFGLFNYFDIFDMILFYFFLINWM